MHLWTSAISFAGSNDSPERLPPQMLRSRTMPAVNSDIYARKPAFSTNPQAPTEAETHLVEVGRAPGTLGLDVEHVDTRAGGVGADGEGGEGERGRLARGRDERAVDGDLELVVVGVQVRGLVQEQDVLARRVPAHCREGEGRGRVSGPRRGPAGDGGAGAYGGQARSRSTCSGPSRARQRCAAPTAARRIREAPSTC